VADRGAGQRPLSRIGTAGILPAGRLEGGNLGSMQGFMPGEIML